MTHQPLIERLQAAEIGSLELSAAMAVACGWELRHDGVRHYWHTPKGANPHAVGKVTTSLDAILYEIERVFPDADLTFERLKPHPWAVVIMKAGWPHFVEATHKSRPLAACIALLRAIEARDMGVGA